MAEEKTNIIRRPNADPGKRQKSGTIQFACGNGHAISVPVRLAGKRGTCSRCGVAVVIPLTSSSVAASSAAAAVGRAANPAGSSEHATSNEPVAAAVDASPLPTEHTPAIDGAEEMPSVETHASPAGPVDGEELPDFSGMGGHEETAAAVDAFAGLSDGVESAPSPGFDGIEGSERPEIDGVDNPTAVLVAKLFGESEHGGVVELHLKSGQIVMPQLYDFTWSRGTHGLFAAENKSDNTITLTAVAWDSVEQVIVRKVRGLPDGMFE